MKFKTFFSLSVTDRSNRPVMRTSGSFEYRTRPRDDAGAELARLLANRAATAGDQATLQFMLAHGLAVRERHVEALPLAIDAGHEACALLLVRAGAALSLVDRDTRQTLLHRAALRGLADLCRALVAALPRARPFKLDACDRQGSTALHCAAASGDVDTVAVLLAAGAARKAKNRHGNTPLSIAQINNHPRVVALLQAPKRDGFFSRLFSPESAAGDAGLGIPTPAPTPAPALAPVPEAPADTANVPLAARRKLVLSSSIDPLAMRRLSTMMPPPGPLGPSQ